MYLRKRLTLLNTLIVGGLLLLFGAVSYQFVSLALTYQIDRQLALAARDVVAAVKATDQGEINRESFQDIPLEENLSYQIWNRNKQLLLSSPNIGTVRPLNVDGFGLTEPVFKDEQLGEEDPLRVLSVPLMLGRRPVGTLMVGADLTIISLIQNSLLSIIFWGVFAAVGLVGFAVWFSTYRALAPLERISRTAMQITRAEDLALRIPYQGPDDEVGQLIAAFNDTLERLESLFNTQRQFISDVSHELRTPLTVIKGNLDLLRRMDCIEEEEFDSINEEVNRLTRMVQDLLLIAQAETGRLPLEMEEISLDTLLLEVVQQAEVLAKGKLTMEIAEIDQVMVPGDRDRLKQVMLNVVSNAVKFTPEGGKVTLKLHKTRQKAVLTITDTGPGIAEEDLPHIFKRFYRTEKARTRTPGSGFGLGLSIAYWIVRNHQGDITVRSREGRGTTFSILLPLSEAQPPKTN